MSLGDKPAHGYTAWSERGAGPASRFSPTSHPGLTLREHYAGLAMQGLMAMDVDGVMGPKWVAGGAVRFADALLAELEATR